jgi:hypothetical protein
MNSLRKRITYVGLMLAALAGLALFAGCGGGGGSNNNNVQVPGAFTLLSPPNNAPSVSVSTPLLFTWQSASGATSYSFDLSNDSNFSTVIISAQSITSASYSVSANMLVGSSTYYWRVKAVNASGSTVATNAPYFFATGTATTAGVLTMTIRSNPSSDLDGALGIAKDANGMYVVGYDSNGGWRIEKHDVATGATLNIVSGVTTTTSTAWAIAIDSSSMYVVGSEQVMDGTNRWKIEKRSLSNLALDGSFGTAVTATTDSEAYAVAIDGSSLYIVGYDTTDDTTCGAEARGCAELRIEKRSLATGVLDSSFGTSGVVKLHISANDDDTANGIALDASSLYIVGSVGQQSNPAWYIRKMDISTGGLLSSVAENPSVYNYGEPFGITIVSSSTNSSMYVVGYDAQTTSQDEQWRIENRNLADLSLVSGFGAGGVIQENPSSLNVNAYDEALAVTNDGSSLYVAGYDSNTSGETEQWRLERRSLTDGSLDASFGSGGIINSNAFVPSGSVNPVNEAAAITFDATSIFVAGYDTPTPPSDQEWRIEQRTK